MYINEKSNIQKIFLLFVKFSLLVCKERFLYRSKQLKYFILFKELSARYCIHFFNTPIF